MSQSSADSSGIRLNRFLAQCGLGSRRGCESIIREGRVHVNGEICVDLATRVLESDSVKVDNKLVGQRETLSILLHKPPGYLCTVSDPKGRKTIYDLLPHRLRGRNLHHAGRLDRDSEGLLIMTNDGELSQRLTHPRSKVEKEYRVVLDKPFDFTLRRKFLEGIPTEEGLARAAAIDGDNPRKLRVVLLQGLKRQIRLMFHEVGYEVKRLTRVRIGNLRDERLGSGDHRLLSKRDLRALFETPREKRRR